MGCGVAVCSTVIGKRDAGAAQQRKNVLHKIIVGNAAAQHTQPVFAAVDDAVVFIEDPLRRIAKHVEDLVLVGNILRCDLRFQAGPIDTVRLDGKKRFGEVYM